MIGSAHYKKDSRIGIDHVVLVAPKRERLLSEYHPGY